MNETEQTEPSLPISQPTNKAMNWLMVVIAISSSFVVMAILGLFAWIYCKFRNKRLLDRAQITTFTLPNLLIEQKIKDNKAIFASEHKMALARRQMHLDSNNDIAVEDIDEAATERIKPTEGGDLL